MATADKTTSLRKKLIITSVVAGLLLIIANSAIWVNRQVFDTAAFTNTAVTSITSESSRQAIGDRITDEALKNNPVIKNIAGDQVSHLISGLFGTDQAEKLITAAASRLQIYLTSNNQQDVDIDLAGLKTTLNRVAQITGSTQNGQVNTENIPDKIVLIEEKNVPDLYNYTVALSWLAPLAFLGAMSLFAIPYFTDRKNYITIMLTHGATLIGVGIISLLLGPLFRPMVLEPFRNVNGRVIVGNLYDAFITTFNTQTMTLIYVGLLVCVLVLGMWVWPQYKKIRKQSKA